MIRRALALAGACLLFATAATAADGLRPRTRVALEVATPPASGDAAVRAAATMTLSRSNSTAISTGSVSCNSGSPSFLHTGNSYYRAFPLSSFPALTLAQFRVDSVSFGVQSANDAAGAGQPITVRLHASSTNPPTLASLSPLTEETVTIPDSASGTLFNVNFERPPALDVATDTLVVEVLMPDGQTAGHSFFIGSNADGQTGASFIRAPTCGFAEIADLETIGFPDMHVVMSVSGNTQVPVTLQSFDVD